MEGLFLLSESKNDIYRAGMGGRIYSPHAYIDLGTGMSRAMCSPCAVRYAQTFRTLKRAGLARLRKCLEGFCVIVRDESLL